MIKEMMLEMIREIIEESQNTEDALNKINEILEGEIKVIKEIIEEYQNADWGEADAEDTLDEIFEVLERR